MDLKIFSTEELEDRCNSLLDTYVSASLVLAKKMEEFGRIRSELQLLTVELAKRGVFVTGSQELQKYVSDQVTQLSSSVPK